MKDQFKIIVCISHLT